MADDDFDFDFGFSLVDSDPGGDIQDFNSRLQDEAAIASAQYQSAAEEREAVTQKLDKIYSMIQPLLANLMENPEKDYILWPNRVEKVEQFQEILDQVYYS